MVLKKKAVVPGKAAKAVVQRITSTDKKYMPPKDPPLTAKVDLVKAWIDQGLQWEEGFSFRKTSIWRR
jgi:hypothetical protein